MGDNHTKVLKGLRKYGKMTLRQISDKTGVKIDKVSGCCNSLVKHNLVKNLIKVKVNNRQVNLWEAQ